MPLFRYKILVRHIVFYAFLTNSKSLYFWRHQRLCHGKLRKMYVRNLDEDCRIKLLLVKNVKNIKAIRAKVLGGELDCCLVKAALVLNPLQVEIAAKKAITSKRKGKLTTKTVNTELLFNLSISKNISQSLAKFGIDDNDKDIVVIVFEEGPEDKVGDIVDQIEGDRCGIEELKHLADEKVVAQAYKIKDVELKVSSLLDSVVSRIATKDFGSF